MKSIILTLTLFITASAFAQEPSSPTLEVVGSAKVTVTPDIGVLTIGIKHIDLSFSEAIAQLNSKTKDINSQLVKIGFKEKDIKTTNFEVNVNSIWKDRERIDSGYVATQNVKLDFENKGEIIKKILNQFSESQTDFRLSFSFKLSEETKTKVQDKIIELATKDAYKKAEQLAKYSNSKIKSLKRINYGNNYFAGMREVQETEHLYEVVAASAAPDDIIGFTPNDIIFRDQVLVTWELE